MKTMLIMLFVAASICACAQDTTVTQIEYFFDSDYGVGNNSLVNVTPAADGAFPFTASIAGLSVGYHKLYIRTKDSQGKWSQTARRNVEIFAANDNAKVTLVSGEYFIDTDTGYGAGHPITVTSPDSIILQDFTAATAGLAVGYHKLYGRLKDNLGRWSQTFRRNMEVYANDTNYIYNAEYFFKTDNGYGNCTEMKFIDPSVDGTFSFNIPLSQIPAEADTMFIRVQDSTEGKWSITAFQNIAVALPLTLLNFTVVKQNNTAQLAWQTTNEVNTAYFNVQRSTDGRSFATIGKITAKGSHQINNNYIFTDDISQLPDGKIYYRLQTGDVDGKQSYSNVRVIDVSGTFRVVIMPNPVINSQATFSIYSWVNARLQVVIYNELGTTVLNEQIDVPSGSTNKRINLSGFAAGNYWVRVSNGVLVQTLQLLKQ